MTDEKKELPWDFVCSYAFSLDGGLYVRGEKTGPFTKNHCGYFITEPEAIRLHALDLEVVKLHERVKKFEEAAKMILELDESHRLFEHNCFYYTDPAESGHKWISATKLLREAMEGENENHTK